MKNLICWIGRYCKFLFISPKALLPSNSKSVCLFVFFTTHTKRLGHRLVITSIGSFSADLYFFAMLTSFWSGLEILDGCLGNFLSQQDIFIWITLKNHGFENIWNKGWRLKKWTGLRGRNSRSRSARVKRLSSADSSQHLQ